MLLMLNTTPFVSQKNLDVESFAQVKPWKKKISLNCINFFKLKCFEPCIKKFHRIQTQNISHTPSSHYVLIPSTEVIKLGWDSL